MNARLATRAGEFDDSAFILKSMLYALSLFSSPSTYTGTYFNH